MEAIYFFLSESDPACVPLVPNPVLWTVFIPPRLRHLDSIYQNEVTHSDLPFSPSTCIDTQAIVIPGPHSQRGQGLRSGFKCLCFSKLYLPVGPSEEEQREHRRRRHDQVTPFHVIFHDWYDIEEARGTQNMLENSTITCNTCKQTIRF